MSSREGGRRALPPRDPVLSGEGETASPDPGTHLAVAELTPSPGPGDRLPPGSVGWATRTRTYGVPDAR